VKFVFSARQFHELRRMDGCRNNTQPYFEEQMMNATNKNKFVFWCNRVGLAIRQRRVSVALALAGLAMLGIALETGQLVPLGLKQTEVTKSISARPKSVLSIDSYHNTSLRSYSPPQAPIPAASPDGDLEVIGDFVLDGLEFTLAGAEVSNQFRTYREIGNTFSWLARELSQPENAQLLASQPPTDASLVAYPLRSPTEREMASWLLQNSPWTH
jgi:hypothetical protein